MPRRKAKKTAGRKTKKRRSHHPKGHKRGCRCVVCKHNRRKGGKKTARKGKKKKGHRKGKMPAGLARYHAIRAARRAAHGMSAADRAKARHARRHGRKKHEQHRTVHHAPSGGGMSTSLRERLLGDKSLQQRLAEFRARQAAKRETMVDVPAGVAL